jgi:two-component system chemotaxis sensor kinase CheA
VLVSVSDDGKGLDLGRIREIAIGRGIVTAEADLTDTEIRNLIFAPGFSTAPEITGVSGRGVGMDVVKKTVDSLGGTIETTSELGVGTTVALRLPLTLAIIDGLLVEVSEQSYVLPLSTVHELLEYHRKDRVTKGQALLVESRGAMLPCIDLRDLFSPDVPAPDSGHVVIVDWDRERIGMVVDEVVGQQQTVIKSLGALSHDVEGISGATILGDGSVALILDIPKLMADAVVAGTRAVREAV